MNLRKTRFPWQNYRHRCFFLHHSRFNMVNLSEINPNFYFLPPLWYPDFPFSRNQQSSDGWKSNICSINYMFFIRTQSYLWAEQDNRQEHIHYQENERGEMIVEPWRERRLRAYGEQMDLTWISRDKGWMKNEPVWCVWLTRLQEHMWEVSTAN